MRSETPLSPFHLVNSQSVGSLSHPSLQITGKTEEAGLHRLRKTRFIEGYGLQPVHKWLRIRPGFTGCGKTRSGERGLFALKGHDFSRADKGNKINGL